MVLIEKGGNYFFFFCFFQILISICKGDLVRSIGSGLFVLPEPEPSFSLDLKRLCTFLSHLTVC